MGQFNVFFTRSWTILVTVILTLGLAACDGDDGAAGAAGAAGQPGTDGGDGDAGLACWDLNGNGVGDDEEDINGDGLFDALDCAGTTAKVTPLESCAVCHDDGSFADATAFHALDPIESVSNVSFAVNALNALDLDITFDVAADGVPATTYDEVQRAYFNNGGTRTDLRDVATLTNNGGGNYTITIAGAAAELANNNRWLLRVQDSAERQSRTYFYADFPASPFAADVSPVAHSAEACAACHGPEGIPVHGSAFIASDGGEPCLVCHGSDESDDPEVVPSLVAVAHGYHNGIAAWENPPEEIEITYPTYMTNCKVCHSEDAQLAAANAMTVTTDNCFSCHGSMASWAKVGDEGIFEEGNFHLDFVAGDNCLLCHDGTLSAAPQTVAEMHNGYVLDNDGILWDGADASLTEGAKFDWQINNVADDGTNLTITWQASYDGVGVDPCNDTVGAGEPVFLGELRTYRSYAQGEDFIMGTSTSQAGQPSRANPTVDNTTCQDGVATTIIPVEEDVVAERGRLALNGKPLVVNVADPAGTMVARVPTPTFDWLVGLGGPAPERRAVVDTDKCVGCHVGSLYQHGGDRVDNVDTCLVCHNAAANEKYARAGYGVDASEAYDGKAGEAFEMKTMVHRIHSANYEFPGDRYNSPYLVYRGRGIYAFARDESDVPNWPGDGDDLPVFGGDGAVQDHHFHAPTYPRSLNECAACHTDGFTVIPDQTKAMASTTDAGSTAWEDQLDDTLQGAATTACITCHADGPSKGHAFQNSWTPQVFPEGRQTIIDAP